MSLREKYILHRGGVRERIIPAEHKCKAKISYKYFLFIAELSKETELKDSTNKLLH